MSETEVMSAVAGVFMGIGGMMMMFVMTYLIYQFARIIKPIADKETKFELFEGMVLDKVAKKKGIDLEKEVLKREIMKKNKKNFRRRIEEEVYDEIFPKNKEKE